MSRALNLFLVLIIVLVLLGAGYYLYERYAADSQGYVLKAIPADAALYIRMDVKPGQMTAIRQKPIWNLLRMILHPDADLFLYLTDSLLKHEVLFEKKPIHLFISVHPVSSERLDLLFLSGTPHPDSKKWVECLLTTLAGNALSIARRKYEGVTLYESTNPQFPFTFCLSNKVLIGSTTAFLVESAIRQQRTGARKFFQWKHLAEKWKAKSHALSFFVHLNHENIHLLTRLFLEKEFSGENIMSGRPGGMSELKIEGYERHLLLSGHTIAKDSLQLSAFLSRQEPMPIRAMEIVPASAALFRWIGVSNIHQWQFFLKTRSETLDVRANQLQHVHFSPDSLLRYCTGEFIYMLIQPSSLQYRQNQLLAIRINQPEQVAYRMDQWNKNFFNDKVTTETYKQIVIQSLHLSHLPAVLMGPWSGQGPYTCYAIVGQYLVFAASASSLRTLIDDYCNNKRLINQSTVKEQLGHLRNKTNYLFYCRLPESTYLLQALLKPTYEDHLEHNRHDWNRWDALAFQMTGGANRCDTRLAFFYEPADQPPSIELIVSERMDTTLSGLVQPVVNAREKFFFIQDDDGILFRFNSSGMITWRNRMPGKIISPVYVTDIFRNGRYQYLFNTAEHLVVIDEDGDFLSNFPIALPAQPSAALRQVRFCSRQREVWLLATDNGRIYAYQPGGKIYLPWNFYFTSPVQTLTYGCFSGYDYLAGFASSGVLLIIGSDGKIMQHVSSDSRPVGLDRLYCDTLHHRFVWTDSIGQVVSWSVKQGLSTTLLTEERVYDFLMEDFNGDGLPDYLFLTDTHLHVHTSEGRPVFSYDFSQNQRPKRLFSWKAAGRVFITCCSGKDDRTWVFEKQAGLYPGSPVQGGLQAFVADMNDAGQPLLITASPAGWVYIYVIR
jgi:hypothetical protein